MTAPSVDLDALIKPLLIKDLRIQCRQRQLTPAGSREDLAQRLKDHMLESGDYNLRNEDGSIMSGAKASQLFGMSNPGNNYHRPEGQNVGNFLGDRPSSRVLAAPGGNSTLSLGFDRPTPVAAPPPAPAPVAKMTSVPAQSNPDKAALLSSMAAKISGKSMPQASAPAAVTPSPAAPAAQAEASPSKSSVGVSDNNYSRPGGQNVGNFLTDKPSSRVLAPPGGSSSIVLG